MEITRILHNNFICIYMFTNKINGKKYIGQTKRLYDRYLRHKSADCDQCLLHKSIKKYGFDSFEFSILETPLEEDLDIRETYWIEHYKTYLREFGYNIEKGPLNKTFPEGPKKMGWKALKKKYPNGRKGKDNPMYGVVLSKESIELRRQIGLARYQGENGELERQKSRERMLKRIKNKDVKLFKKGDKHPPEVVEKIRAAAKKNAKKRPIACIDENGVETKYESVNEAARSVKGTPSGIAKAIRENRKYYNLTWYYLGEAKYGESELSRSA